MKALIYVSVVVLLCVLFSSDEAMTVLASPRVVFVLALVFWMRCEWCMRLKVEKWCQSMHSQQTGKMVKENYELSQTVMNLSDQHTLLCEIRNGVHRSVRGSKDVLAQLNLSPSPVGLPRCSSNSPPCVKARENFRKGSVSEGDFSMYCSVSDTRITNSTPPPLHLYEWRFRLIHCVSHVKMKIYVASN